MREIRFRVVQNGTIIGHEFIREGVWCFQLTKDPVVRVGTIPLGLNKVSREQYCGIKDKNGTKIFEGDILRVHLFNWDETEREIVSEIQYVTEGFIAFWSIKDPMSDFPDSPNPITSFDGMHEESLEVIGNIHQNPELIKQIQ